MSPLISSSIRSHIRRLSCTHDWHVATEPYDSDEAAAYYRDGLTYTPRPYLVCSKCQKRRPMSQDRAPIGWQLVGFPLFIIYMLVIMVLTPLLIIIAVIYEEFRPPKTA